MQHKSLRQALHSVDPNLTIIPGGTRHRNHRPPKKEWEACTGIICKSCGKEVYRSRDGLCMRCWETANEFEIRDKAGVLEFLPMDIIKGIVRPAKGKE